MARPSLEIELAGGIDGALGLGVCGEAYMPLCALRRVRRTRGGGEDEGVPLPLGMPLDCPLASAMVIAAGHDLRMSADILEVLLIRAGALGGVPAAPIDADVP